MSGRSRLRSFANGNGRMDRAMRFRVRQQFTGQRRFSASSEEISTRNAITSDNSAEIQQAARPNTSTESFVVSNVPDEFMENTDPLKRRILPRRRRPWIIRKLIAPIAVWLIAWWRKRHRQLTKEEINQIEQGKLNKLIARNQMRDAEAGIPLIINTLTRLGFCYIRSEEGQRKLKDFFTIDQVAIYSDRFIYHIGHYPFGEHNKAVNILDRAVLNEIGRAVGHSVSGNDRPESGTLFIVEITSTAGIPDLITFSDMMKTRPAMASDLTIPIGIAPGGRTIWRDIDDAPHWLVGGTTGMGKSNIENVWLCSILSSGVRPERVRMLMIDAKRTELTPYKGIPHLLTDPEHGIVDGIACTAEDALLFIKYMRRECERRMKLFEGKYNDIREYNKHHSKKGWLPRLLVWIDELGLIALVPKLGNEFNEELIGISNIGRAMGIYVLIFTQKPEAKVIDTRITMNTDGRLAFGCPSGPASQILLNSWDAVGLPIGRAVFQMRGDKSLVQTPILPAPIRRSIIADLRAGRQVSPEYKATLDPEEIVKWAADQNSGSLRRDDLFRKFGEHEQRISYKDLGELLRSMDGNIYEADGNAYRVLPARAQFERKLELCDSDLVQSKGEVPEPVFSPRTTPDTPEEPVLVSATGGDEKAWEDENDPDKA